MLTLNITITQDSCTYCFQGRVYSKFKSNSRYSICKLNTPCTKFTSGHSNWKPHTPCGFCLKSREEFIASSIQIHAVLFAYLTTPVQNFLLAIPVESYTPLVNLFWNPTRVYYYYYSKFKLNTCCSIRKLNTLCVQNLLLVFPTECHTPLVDPGKSL